MAMDTATLDTMQADYEAAVEHWITAIRKEEALASGNHNEAQVDQWEGAAFDEETARKHAKDAKKQYEDALRQEFFNF